MIRIVAPLISAAAIASQAVAAPLPRAQPGTVAARQWDQAPSWEQAPPPSWDGSSPPSHEWTPPPAPEHQQPAEWQEPPKEEHVPPPAEWQEPPKEEHIPPPPAHEPPKEEYVPPPAEHETYTPPVEHDTYTPPVEHETYTPPVEHESVYESWPPAHETTYPPSHETTATYESWPETYTPPSYPPPEGWYEGQPVPEGWYTSEASWYKYEDVPHTTTGWYPPAHPTPYPSPPEGWKEGQPAPEGWYTSEGSWYKYEDVPHTTTGWYPPAHPTPYPSPPEGWKEGHPAPEGWYTSEGSWYKYETTPPAAPHETGVPPPSGATHTVYVSPEGYKGYVPFAVNAPVGDTIEFVWKQGPHTVSKSTINNICSRIEDDTFFTSGRQEAGATFHKVVNDTAPVWLYDNVDENCETGFWGVINPPANGGSNSTIADKLKEWTETYPDLKQQWEYIKEYAKEDPKYESALKWGDDIDVGQWEEKYYKDAAEKVMETRYWAIINEGVLESGKRKDGAEIEWPDFKAAVASAPPSTEQTPEEQAQIEADNLSQEEGASSGFAVRPTHAVAGLAMFFAAFLF